MRIFITGGSGFIGRNISEHMEKKHTVFAPPHRTLDLLDGEKVEQFITKNKIDIIIHCAVRPGHRNAKDPTNQLFINTRMFFNIVRNLKKVKKMIFISSGNVYDMRHYKPKMKEDYFDKYVPYDEGGFSKYISGRYIEQSDKVVELRVFGIFGKYEDYAIRFISNAICKTLFDLPITMKQNRRFDYIYINDLMPILDYFINNRSRYKAYNVTPDKSIDLYSLAKKVKKISGKNLTIIIGKSGMGIEYSGDNRRLREEIRGLKFTPMDDAIRDLFNWYSKRIHSIERANLLVDR